MGKPDSVPPLELGKVRGGPIDQYLDPYLKRIRNSLDEKAKKFKTYLGKRLVGQNDILVSHLQNPNGTSRAKYSDLIFGDVSASDTSSWHLQHF